MLEEGLRSLQCIIVRQILRSLRMVITLPSCTWTSATIVEWGRSSADGEQRRVVVLLLSLYPNSYKCLTCSDRTFCSRCFKGHDQSHTLTVVSMAEDGIWDSRPDDVANEQFLRDMRSLGVPWPGDVAK